MSACSALPTSLLLEAFPPLRQPYRLAARMKRTTATQNVSTIVQRLRAGVCDPWFRITHVWVFGSYLRGQVEPEDIDLVIDGREVRPFLWRGTRFMNEEKALIELRRGMKGIQYHRDIDADFGGAPPMLLWARDGRRSVWSERQQVLGVPGIADRE